VIPQARFHASTSHSESAIQKENAILSVPTPRQRVRPNFGIGYLFNKDSQAFFPPSHHHAFSEDLRLFADLPL
jgi:hypothetical protein